MRLKESIVRKAIQNLDWPSLCRHLSDVGLDRQGYLALLGHLRRTNNLIFRYPDPAKERSRDVFLQSLASFAESTIGDEAEEMLWEETRTIEQIEQGYRWILKALDKCAAYRLPPPTRVAAYIARAVDLCQYTIRGLVGEIESREGLHLPQYTLVETEDGNRRSPDSMFQAIVGALTTSLKMEAHKNGWFDRNDHVVLPLLPQVSESDVFKAGSISMLAILWQRWQRIEERLRYLGGALRTNNKENAAPRLLTYDPPREEFFDYAANERLNDMIGQVYARIVFETPAADVVIGVHSTARLAPDDYVTVDEIWALVTLSQALSYEVEKDRETLCGLRLTEWVRGYAVLQQLAKERAELSSAVAGEVFTVDLAQIIDILTTCGLSTASAGVFVDAAALDANSKDLFDTPLMKTADGSLLVFGPALHSMCIARVVLSRLACLRVPLTRKGKAFERDVLKILQSRGLNAKGFTVHRNGEEYDYDVVLDWNGYVFLFECKNNGLSNGEPIPAYYCMKEARSNISQVKRLADALMEYPDILQTQMGIDVSSKTIVPCVLNALTYSLPGRTFGVYVTDASALEFFLDQRYVRISCPYRLGGTTVVHRLPAYALWSSDRPTPDDLIRYMDRPFQIGFLGAHTEIEMMPAFEIGADTLVSEGEFVRTETTLDSFCDYFGANPEVLREQVDKFFQAMDEAAP